MSEAARKEEETDQAIDTDTGTPVVVPASVINTEESKKDIPSPVVKAEEPVQAIDEESPADVEDVEPQKPQLIIPPKPAPQDMPSAGPVIDVVGNLPPAENAMQKTAEHMAMANDLDAGLIHPKTYQEMFSKNKDGSEKGTLGKLGTIFGLLVSGAGSGLSHQPNMLMDMMNKEIERDLESQKLNQANKQSWFNNALSHERALAEIELNNAHTNAINTGAWGKAEEAQFQHWKNTQLGAHLDNAASTDALNMMHLTNIQMRQEQVNKMPPGLAKNAAQSVIDKVLKPSALQRIQQNNQSYANRKALMDAKNPNPLKGKDKPIDPRGPAIDEQKLNQMMLQGNAGNINPELSVTPHEAQAIAEERRNMEENRNHYADYVDNFKALDQMGLAGQVPAGNAVGSALKALGTAAGGVLGSIGGPLGTAAGAGAGAAVGNVAGHAANDLKSAFEQERSAYMEGIKQLIGKDMGEDEKQKLVDSFFPTWFDSKRTRAVKLKQARQFFLSNRKEFSPVSQIKGLKVPFPGLNYTPIGGDEDKKEEPTDTTTATEGE